MLRYIKVAMLRELQDKNKTFILPFIRNSCDKSGARIQANCNTPSDILIGWPVFLYVVVIQQP